MDEEAVPISKSGILPALASLSAENPNKTDVLEDVSIFNLANEPGWESMKKRILAEKENLRELADMVQPTDTPAIIGFKFLASRLAMDKLQWVINTVEGTRTHVEQERTQASGESGDGSGTGSDHS